MDNPQVSASGQRPTTGNRLRRLERLVSLLDDRFRIPGTRIRFGLDPVIGLIPGVGDAVSLGSSLWLIAEARAAGAPMGLILRMVWNSLIDAMLGAIPLIGDLFDVANKANRRNLELLRRHLES